MKKLFASLLSFIMIITFSVNVFAMQIFVKMPSDKHITLEVESSDKIEDIREKIFEKEGIAPSEQCLTFAGKELEDDNTLQDYSVTKDSTLILTIKSHKHCVCGKTDCSSTLEEHDKNTKWVAWDGNSDIPYADNVAYVYLTKDSFKNIIVEEGKTLCLCLNGYNIANMNGDVIVVKEGGHFEITDCDIRSDIGAITHFNYREYPGRGICNNGTLVLWNGNVTENITDNNGAGIYNSGIFKMYGGNISNNSTNGSEAGGYGGGIYNSGTFELIGGFICGNKANNNGGGVFNTLNFDMNDGSISGNCANEGGGVFNNSDSGVFTMTGGVIGGTSDEDKNTADFGGGVYNYEGVFNLSGTALISKNIAFNCGGGVRNAVGTFNMFDKATIANNRSISDSINDGGGGVFNTATFNMYDEACITGNSSLSYGGGIACYNGSINIGDIASITVNSATKGGGVYIGGTMDNNSPLKLSGSAVIFDNRNDNLYLDDNVTVVAKDLIDGSYIGITTAIKPIDNNLIVISNDTVTKNYFVSDNDNYLTIKNSDNRIVLVTRSSHITHISNNWLNDDTNHWKICDMCNQEFDKQEHFGGKATCVKGKICTTCNKEYGSLDSNNHSNLKHVEAKAPTTSSLGNKEYWYCDGCNKYYSNENADVEITKESTQIPILPSIIKGKNQSITVGDKKELSFSSNADINTFIRVELDNVILETNKYTKKSGSTIIVLNANYVSLLSVGNHTLGIVSSNGTAIANFTINEINTKSYDSKDKNQDGVISCEEEKNSANWIWSTTKKTCVYKVSNTSVR